MKIRNLETPLLEFCLDFLSLIDWARGIGWVDTVFTNVRVMSERVANMRHLTMLGCKAEDELAGESKRVKSFHDRNEKFYDLIVLMLS